MRLNHIARINIRGFNQRNVAVMINGVPVNDMENGWVYWSNWGGLGDVTSSIQVQRGMGASSLAISSVGGTMNIVTDAAATVVYKRFADHYADFDPSDRTDAEEEGTQSWMIPNYDLVDLHLWYNVPNNIQSVDITLFAHIFNLFDTKHITDAEDGNKHNADSATVFFGAPRNWNFGFIVSI